MDMESKHVLVTQNVQILSHMFVIRSFDRIKAELRSCFKLDRVRIIFGIDLSASNEWQGRQSFHGQSLHKIQGNRMQNPYQKVTKCFVEHDAMRHTLYCCSFSNLDDLEARCRIRRHIRDDN
jgi:hypothetical protein